MYESLALTIVWLIRKGYSIDLLEALTGESLYSSEEAYSLLDIHSRHLRSMAILHLEYLIKNKSLDLVSYPNLEFPNFMDGTKVLSSYREYFEAWLLAGFPGLSLDQLDKLAADKKSVEHSGSRLEF